MKVDVNADIATRWEVQVGNVYLSVSKAKKEVRLKTVVAMHEGVAAFLVFDMTGAIVGSLTAKVRTLSEKPPVAFVPNVRDLVLDMQNFQEALDARDKKAGRK